MERWFTADQHFGHSKLVEVSRRQFSSVVDMDECVIERYNAVVSPGDVVYHLGDFAVTNVAGEDRIRDIFKRLNGTKILIRGNHDFRNKFVQKLGWDWVGDIKSIKIDGVRIVMCHYPMQVWEDSVYGSWHLYGHVHAMLPEHHTCLKTDVGVDAHGMSPVSFDQIRHIMSSRKFVAPDKRKAYYAEDIQRHEPATVQPGNDP